MSGLICIAPSPNNYASVEQLEKMIAVAMGRGHLKTDRFCRDGFCGARLHLGTFNPGPQPAFNHDRSLCVFFEGEIYGVGADGNDAEYCLSSYEKEGADFIHRLNGSFIICIHDFNQRKTLIASDRFGSRPHFFALDSDRLLFAPSAAAVALAGGEPRLDEIAVANWFVYGKLLGDKTFFKGVRAFPAGTILTFQNGRADFERYWDFPYLPDRTKSEAQFVDELSQALDRAMTVRTNYSRRASVSLSGGLDSRLIAGFIPENDKENFEAFSFGPVDCEEVKIARRVARQLGLRWQNVEITSATVAAGAAETVEISEGMDYIGVGYIPQVHELAAASSQVVFDGFGLDLTLGGSYLDKFSHIKNRPQLIEDVSKTNLFCREEREALFVTDFYKKSRDWPRIFLGQCFGEPRGEELANEIDRFFLDNHVRRFTMEGYRLMRSRVEHCAPSMDNGFIDVIMALPPEMRAQHHIYRRLLAARFPKLAIIPYNSTGVRADAPHWLWHAAANFRAREEVLRQTARRLTRRKLSLWTKRNYVDFEKWFAADAVWRSFFEGLLLDEKIFLAGKYLNRGYIAKLFSQQYAGERDNSMKILYIATFELFLRRFFPDI